MFKPNSKKKIYQISLRKLADISRRYYWFSREMTSENRAKKSILMTRHYPDLGSASDWLKTFFNQSVISMEFLRSLCRRHLAGKPLVASPNVGCFLRLLSNLSVQKKWKTNITMWKYCWKFFFWMATIPFTESKDRTILILTLPIDITWNILTRSALVLLSGFSWHNLKLNKENFLERVMSTILVFSLRVLLQIHSWRSKDSLYLLIS